MEQLYDYGCDAYEHWSNTTGYTNGLYGLYVELLSPNPTDSPGFDAQCAHTFQC